MPKEITYYGIYFPPLLLCVFLGFTIAYVVSGQLNKYGLSDYFFYPPLAYFAMGIIFTILSNIIIPF